jgi:hypothetical protein
MSNKLIGVVWDTDIGPANKRLILLALADASSPEGVSWPSMATLARQAGCGLSTARRLVAELEADGYVRRQQRREDRERNQSNLYHLDVNRLVDNARKTQGTENPTPAQIEREDPPGSERHSRPVASGTPARYRATEPLLEPLIEPKEGDAAAREAGSAEQLPLVPVQASPKAKGAETRRVPIDPRWTPSTAYVDQIKAEGHFTREQFLAELNKFRNYYLGKGDKAVDWEPLFRNWLYKARSDYRPASNRPIRPTESDYATTFGVDADGNWSTNLRVRKVER